MSSSGREKRRRERDKEREWAKEAGDREMRKWENSPSRKRSPQSPYSFSPPSRSRSRH